MIGKWESRQNHPGFGVSEVEVKGEQCWRFGRVKRGQTLVWYQRGGGGLGLWGFWAKGWIRVRVLGFSIWILGFSINKESVWFVEFTQGPIL